MTFHSWRLCGITATIIIYVFSILLLSFNTSPSSSRQRREHLEQFLEYPNYKHRRVSGLSHRATISWCTELKYFSLKETDNSKHHNVASTFTFGYGTDIEFSSSSLGRGNNGLTALASFPGSGNTWLRYLLQQATGILTGSIYKDYGLLKSGFPAENISNSSVLLVKTHEWGPTAWLPFSKAILLVRDPDKAIIAEFNRQSGGHIGFASPDRYKRTKGKYWKQFVSNKLYGWEVMNLSWARNFTGSLKIVHYDDLVQHLEAVLRSILEFLEFPINESLLKCTLQRKEGIFRRKKRILSFDPYTPEMHQMLDERKRYVYQILNGLHTDYPINNVI